MSKRELKTSIALLTHLRDKIVPKIPEDEFDMANWGRSEFRPDEARCVTVACLGGHAAMDPMFRRKGLHLEVVPDRSEGEENMIALRLFYKGCTNFTALSEFFYIDGNQCEYLFGPWGKRERGPLGRWVKRPGKAEIKARLNKVIKDQMKSLENY